ncbi:MAG TPA: glycosyltransferase [Labilithrix sp.]|nr:glycosyltransferase [Labilithrix sp.]
MSTNDVQSLAIVLPVLNEGINLRIMLKILRATVDVPHEVLVVCDSPDDDSIPVVEHMQRDYEHVRVVHNTLGRGVINAIRAGVAAANSDVILIFAADEVGPVLAIDDMLELIREGNDFVSCTRYAHGGRRLGGSVIGGVMSRTANRLFSRIAGSALSDATTGIKMFRKSLFDELALESKPVGWAVAFEMSIKAQLRGLRLAEVPIVSIDRLYGGKSTFKLGPWTVEYLKWFVWGASRMHRAPKQTPAVRIPRSINWRGKTSVDPPESLRPTKANGAAVHEGAVTEQSWSHP